MDTKKQHANTKINFWYWTLIILLAAFFTLSGFLEITKNPITYLKTLQMGYPPYFITTLGIAKILGSIVLVIPRWNRIKEWVFAGFIFDVIFAFISGIAINSYTDCIKSSVAFCIVLTAYASFYKTQFRIKTTH